MSTQISPSILIHEQIHYQGLWGYPFNNLKSSVTICKLKKTYKNYAVTYIKKFNNLFSVLFNSIFIL